MHRVVLLLLVAVVAAVLADGQYYVPRSYYTIDAEGHVSNPVPLRRLRRSLAPWPYNQGGANANANAEANARAQGGGRGGNANADARANANAIAGSFTYPAGAFGSGYVAAYH